MSNTDCITPEFHLCLSPDNWHVMVFFHHPYLCENLPVIGLLHPHFTCITNQVTVPVVHYFRVLVLFHHLHLCENLLVVGLLHPLFTCITHQVTVQVVHFFRVLVLFRHLYLCVNLPVIGLCYTCISPVSCTR